MDAKPEPSTPPPRAPSRTRMALPILAVVAVIAALSALLVLWSPWSGAEGQPKPDGSTTGQRSSTPDESPTGEPSTPPDEPTGSNGGQPTGSAGTARVPTVVGMPVRQAIAEISRKFTDVALVGAVNGAGEACAVIAQDPQSGEYPTDTTVTLTFAGTDTECLA